MAEYYRTSFMIETVRDNEKLQGHALLDSVMSVVTEWADDRKGTVGTVRTDSDSLEEEGFFSVTLEHPDTDTVKVKWRVDFRCATAGRGVEAAVDVRRMVDRSERSEGFNSSESAQRPKVLEILVKNFVCTIGGNVLSTEASYISPEDANSFVDNILFDQNRRVPLVVLSENMHGGMFMNANRLQSRLLGLAIVSTYDNHTARLVTDEIGDHRLGCWDGSLRVYRPRSSPEDGSWQNRFWAWQSMNYTLRTEGWDQLFRDVGDECLSLALPQLGPRLYDEVSARVRRVRYERLLERLRSTEAATQVESEYRELLDYADGITRENDEIRIENEELSNRISELQTQISDKDSVIEELNVSLRYQDSGMDDFDEDEGSDELPPEFSSVYQVVEYSSERLDGLRFFPRTVEFAKASQFPRPNDVYGVFYTLNECAEEMKANSALGRSLQEWFEEKGVDFAPHESETTMGKFGKSRTFYDDSQRRHIVMQKHVKLGGGLGEHNQLRIHLEWDENERKWLVGYIGRHLRTATG